MLIALILQAAAVAALPSPPDVFAQRAWAHFSRAPALKGTSETVDVAIIAMPPRSNVAVYAMRITRRRFQQADTTGWADSRSCPAMLPALKAMRALAVPHPTVPGMEQRPGSIMVDGIGYRLWTQARFDGGGEGRLDFDSNVGTPLAAWVDKSLDAVSRCWSAVEPRVG